MKINSRFFRMVNFNTLSVVRWREGGIFNYNINPTGRLKHYLLSFQDCKSIQILYLNTTNVFLCIFYWCLVFHYVSYKNEVEKSVRNVCGGLFYISKKPSYNLTVQFHSGNTILLLLLYIKSYCTVSTES